MKRLSYRRVVLTAHLLFWSGYLLMITFLFAFAFPLELALVRTIGMGICLAFLAYFHLYFLMPRFFEQGKFGWHGLYTLLAILAFSLLRMAVDALIAQRYGVDLLFPLRPIPPVLFSGWHAVSAMVTGFLIVFITAPLKLIELWHQRQQLREQLRSQKLEAELNFLKAQVNPHFLFNALNKLYSLAYTQSPQAAPAILKLSEMMRYMLYECQSERVPLEQELRYLHNYLDLQRLKTEQPQQISFEVKGNPAGIQVPPLLLVPLLENALKHGNLEAVDTGWLRLALSIEAKRLLFTIENSIPNQARKDPVGGIGLNNLRQRLNHLYPDTHQFDLDQTEDQFAVSLSLPL